MKSLTDSSTVAQKLPSESQEQSRFVRWFRDSFDTLIFAIPNGAVLGGRNRFAQMNKLKSEGFVKGIPDLYVPAWRLWIEFKRQKGGVLSAEQKEMIGYLESIGDTVLVAKGCDHGQQLIMDYLERIDG